MVVDDFETVRKRLGKISKAVASRKKQGGVQTIDAYSPTFGLDLERVFKLNVARARRDNKRIIGTADLKPRKRRPADLLDTRRAERLRKE